MKKMFLHLKIKTITKQNLSQKSMINKNDQPLFVATPLCTDRLPGGQRTMSSQAIDWSKQVLSGWEMEMPQGLIIYQETRVLLYIQGERMKYLNIISRRMTEWQKW